MKNTRVGIIGATGLVGIEMIKVLEEYNLEIEQLRLFSSESHLGQTIKYKDKDIKVECLSFDSFDDLDYALFATDATLAKKYIPYAVKKKVICIDNSSCYRMKKNVPLVVPEINYKDIELSNSKIISNPNCSTIQSVMVLKPLDKYFKLKKVIFTTYQSISGAGKNAIKDYYSGLKQEKMSLFPYNITENLIPQIDEFMSNSYTKEEMKMVNETKKILHLKDLQVASTCIRVPILKTHGVVIHCEFEKNINIPKVRKLLKQFPGIIVKDDIKNQIYPIADFARDNDFVYVGRIRKDLTNKKGLFLYVVSDNLRKGAASNAIQILRLLLKKQRVEAKKIKN